MPLDFEAVYENGAFRPIGANGIHLSEGEHVRISVDIRPSNPGTGVLDLAAQVYAGLSDQDIADVERIALDRTDLR